MTAEEQIRTYNMSVAYLNGKGVPQDVQKSFALNAEVARQGFRDAVLAMGWYYLGGVGVARDYAKAKKWYLRSARHGEPKAMFSLGRIFYMEQDFAASLIWFNRAAEAGHARSIYWIAKHYWYGQGLQEDKKEAVRLFHLAAGQKVIAARRIVKYLSRRKK